MLYTRVGALICPSESIENAQYGGSFTNYRACFGGPAAIAGYSGVIVPMHNDNFGTTNNAYQPSTVGNVRIASVTDGTSNTAVFSERLVGINLGTLTVSSGINARRALFPDPTGNSMYNNIDTGSQTIALTFVNQCKSQAGTTTALKNNPSWSGQCWTGSHVGTLEFNSYNHVLPPNSLSCGANSPGSYGDGITATSLHSGGVNVAFVDGSVHFVKDSISPNIWWALGSRGMGEVVSSNSY